jgi:DNA-binding response OmpR family regulator
MAIRDDMRLLVIEDDASFGSAVQKALQRSGHAVDWLVSGDNLAATLRSVEYDCVLLDLGLQGRSGEDCLNVMQLRNPPVPVIVISAHAGLADRIRLLELGAADYLVKPVDLEEMHMRVHAVTRRFMMARGGDTVLTHGALTMRPASRVAAWHGSVVPLTVREFLLLEALVRKKDHILSRDQLEEALYGWGDDINSNAVEVYIHHLRRKFGPGLIETVRGLGYRLATPRE